MRAEYEAACERKEALIHAVSACLRRFQGSRVTSDGDLILIRELDERPGLEKLIEEQLSDLKYASAFQPTRVWSGILRNCRSAPWAAPVINQ